MQLYGKKTLNSEELHFCRHIMSADAFAAMIIHHLTQGQSATCVRASDGERALIAHAQYDEPLAPFLRDPSRLQRYGVEGADLKVLGKQILEAGDRATYLAPTISGLWLPEFKVNDMFFKREVYVDIFYPYCWGRNIEVLMGVCNAAKTILLAHHKAQAIVERYNLNKAFTAKFVGYPMTSWRQHSEIVDTAVREQADLVLVCGGPHGKVLVDKLGQLTDMPRVSLDVGSAVENGW